jgi:putative oxidoreductase
MAGVLMAIGRRARCMAGGLFVICTVAIVPILRHFGCFVGEHGAGGSPYRGSPVLALLVIVAADAPAASRPSR